MTESNHPQMSLPKMATILGVSQPFLSQIRAGKRPMPEALRTKVEALGAYHLLITDKQSGTTPAAAEGGQSHDIGVKMMVEVKGIEPLAPCMQSRCSPAELHPHKNTPSQSR